MLDCFALWVEHARLQCDIDFGFHSVRFSAASRRPADLHIERRHTERGILRQNIAFRVVNIIVFPASFVYRLCKRKFTMASPYPEGGPPSGAPGGKTSIGLDSNLGAALCYWANFICCIGLVLAIIFLATEKENRFVKFHAVQSLFLIATQIAVGIVIGI